MRNKRSDVSSRPRSRARPRSWAILSAILLLPLSAALAQPPSTAWEIDSDTTFEDIPLVLAQDIIVMPGATLRLKTVDALVARPLNITVRGALELVEGTRLAAAAFPFDLYIAPGGSLLASDASIVGARIALAGDANVESTALMNGAFNILANGDAAISGSTFDAAIGPAVLVRPSGYLLLANSSVGQTGDYGVRIERGSARIENASFALSPSYSLYANGADVTLVDSTFSAHCGAFLVGGSDGVIARNTFATLDHGISLVGAGAVDVLDNVFDGTAEALLVYGGTTEARRNEFDDNDVAVHVIMGSSTTPLLRGNAFIGNGVAVDNDIASAVDAAYNWWGFASGPAAADTSGSVTVSPWLTLW